MVDTTVNTKDLLRLQAWLSPAFPIGSFSYSHGLEEVVARGDVVDTGGLFLWTETAVQSGGGRVDGMLLAEAWRSVDSSDNDRLTAVAELGAVMRGTSELATESLSQGEAFLETAQAAWPDEAAETYARVLPTGRVALPVSVGLVAACHGVSLEVVLPMYLQSFAVGIVSAGLRLIPLGQTDGQRVIARLQPVVERTTNAAIAANFADIGGAAAVIDLASMAHESRDGRLFRS
ncbi:MAG: urease accessory protein UreF [Chloroflexi bacterium]|jgi:urease accessory protein|nr:urease accessory protein UreF [Chloroflexota bacterium]MBT4072673.1 urease accessory protein UreF [Chloroflexota bacterium]MBT4513786.1 urease accessory protein UreF [Chloroflexota bacterium]MBT5318757.1 urease accessory protein UreF [Chloroflexota bacterium]